MKNLSLTLNFLLSHVAMLVLIFASHSAQSESTTQLSTAASSSTVSSSFEIASELYRQKNYQQAFAAFSSLAQSGDPRAQTVTALMHKFGEGTEQDFEASFKWYLMAAEQDYPAAQYHTGAMLADGIGTEANETLAITWLTAAAENGFTRAIDKLAELNSSASILNSKNDELKAWSTDWDLKLPSDMVLLDPRQQPLEPIKPHQVYLVQVGAMSTRTAANRLWDVLQNQHQALFQNRVPIITTAENSKRRIYRIHTGPFVDFKSADEFCNRLMTSTVQAGCLPIKRN